MDPLVNQDNYEKKNTLLYKWTIFHVVYPSGPLQGMNPIISWIMSPTPHSFTEASQKIRPSNPEMVGFPADVPILIIFIYLPIFPLPSGNLLHSY
jgi:hypothetical protein